MVFNLEEALMLLLRGKTGLSADRLWLLASLAVSAAPFLA